MWILLLLIVLFVGITRIQEGYTELTLPIFDLSKTFNKQVTIDQIKVANLSEQIDHQTEQLNKIDSIIATFRAQNNNV